MLRKLLKREDGQGMAEYGLILALVAIVVVATVRLMGDKLVNLFKAIITWLNVS